MRRSGTRVALIALDGFTAVTAAGGGIALAAGVEGARFPAAWLRGTPFSSYVVPGLILAGVVGGSATVAAAATLRSPRVGGPASLLAGLVLIGWIAGEIALLKQTPPGPTWSEAGYFAIGGLMALLGLQVARAERKVRLPRMAGW
jgi:hypothetical protein